MNISLHQHYFTRTTPSFLEWKQPSGPCENCKSSDSLKPLYEENGFGCKEWLFKDYYYHKDNQDYLCKEFLQAFNPQNFHIPYIDKLYLYTAVCKKNRNSEIKRISMSLLFVQNVFRIKRKIKN